MLLAALQIRHFIYFARAFIFSARAFTGSSRELGSRPRGGFLSTVFHAKRVECALFHLLVNISGILHARPTYDISSRSPIFGDHFDTNGKMSHDSHVTQLAEEVTRF